MACHCDERRVLIREALKAQYAGDFKTRDEKLREVYLSMTNDADQFWKGQSK